MNDAAERGAFNYASNREPAVSKGWRSWPEHESELTLLRSILRGQDGPAYGYIVDTVRCDGGSFVQTGSGPNFQGDLITLSTCKHQMRSGVPETAWSGAWVAGFTGVDVIPGNRVNYLVYL